MACPCSELRKTEPAELPSRQFYTLLEAAAELNRVYGRTDIDENYILQLASMDEIAVQWLYNPNDDQNFLFIPNFYNTETNETDTFKIKENDTFDDLFIRLSKLKLRCLVELRNDRLHNLIFSEKVKGNSLSFVNLMILEDGLKSILTEGENISGDFFILEYENTAPEFEKFLSKCTKKIQYSINSKFQVVNHEGVASEEIVPILVEKLTYDTFFKSEVIYNCRYEIRLRSLPSYKDDLFLEKISVKEVVVKKSEIYVLGAHLDQYKTGTFTPREMSPEEIKQRNNHSLNLNNTSKIERPSNQRRLVLAALRNMAKCNSGKPYKDAEVLIKLAEVQGLEMPANLKTVAKHMYPDQNIDD